MNLTDDELKRAKDLYEAATRPLNYGSDVYVPNVTNRSAAVDALLLFVPRLLDEVKRLRSEGALMAERDALLKLRAERDALCAEVEHEARRAAFYKCCALSGEVPTDETIAAVDAVLTKEPT
jgi:hypothetical protein